VQKLAVVSPLPPERPLRQLEGSPPAVPLRYGG
jgi:hypothetical protein